LMDKLRSDGIAAQNDAAEKVRNNQHEEALQILRDYLASLGDKPLEAGQLTLLRRPIDARISQYSPLRDQGPRRADETASRNERMEKVEAGFKADELKKKNVEKLMREYNVLYKEGKYGEAEGLAMRAHELDPDSAIITAAITMARRSQNKRA